MERPGRTILHLDADAFFAQVEVLAAPHLAGRPVIVGGEANQRRRVACASYEARRFGVRTGILLRDAARLCPSAVFLPCHPRRIADASVAIHRLLLAPDRIVERASVDEFFLQLPEGTQIEIARETAEDIRRVVLREAGLRLSVGIGPNKLLARIATRSAKPDGVAALDARTFLLEYGGDPVGVLPGVGRKGTERLREQGIETLEQLRSAPDELLARALGSAGRRVRKRALGIDDTPVYPLARHPGGLSIGRQLTLPQGTASRQILRMVFSGLAEQLALDLRRQGRRCKGIEAWVDLDRGSTLRIRFHSATPLYRAPCILSRADALLDRIPEGERGSRVGLKLSAFCPASALETGDLFEGTRWGFEA